MSETAADLRAGAPSILAANYVMIVLTTVAVALRFIARISTKVGIKSDDWSIFASWALFILTTALLTKSQLHALHLPSMADPTFVDVLKYEYLYAIFVAPSLACVMTSTVLLYRRIFPGRKFKFASLALIILSVLWAIPTTLAGVFTCSPPSSFWLDPLHMAENCIYYGTCYIIITTFEVFLNLLIVILPIPEVWALQLPPGRKLIVMSIFMLGGFVIISGTLRNVLSYRAGDFMVKIVPDAFWTTIHGGIAIVSACLPTYKPLIRISLDRLGSAGSYITGSSRSSRSKDASSNGASDKQNGSFGQHGNTSEGGYEYAKGSGMGKGNGVSEVFVVDMPTEIGLARVVTQNGARYGPNAV